MARSNVLEKIGRAVFESPFAAKRLTPDGPEIAEIRLALLDEVKAKSHRVSGKFVFPFNVVRMQLSGISEEQAAVLTGEFLQTYFTNEMKAGLVKADYRFPQDLRIEIRSTPALPGIGEDWFAVETTSERNAKERAAIDRDARLIVVSGTANCQVLSIKKTRINIGRTAETFRGNGPSRQNDLAFIGEGDLNCSVSREHAHILYSKKSGEYRLFNDRIYKGDTNCGLWILRDGLSQPVHRGSRGTSLYDGDEIHLGRAVLRLELEEAAPAT